MSVNEKIRAIREVNQWSQEEMAEKMQMSTNTYARFERGGHAGDVPCGRRHFYAQRRLAASFSMGQFLGGYGLHHRRGHGGGRAGVCASVAVEQNAGQAALR